MVIANSEHYDNRTRNSLIVGFDLLCWPIGFAFSALVDGVTVSSHVARLIVGAFVLQVIVGWVSHLYRRRFRPMSFEELVLVAFSFLVTGIVVVVADIIFGGPDRFGRNGVLAIFSATGAAYFHRFLRRLRTRYAAYRHAAERRPVLVLGAGEGGYRAVGAMLNTVGSPYRPVALLDDDPDKANTRISRLRVRGTSAHMEAIAKQFGATAIVLATPSADSATLQRLHALAQAAGLETLVLPPVQRLVGAGSTTEITRYAEEDILNRKIVDIDMAAVRAIVEGESVVVTGAGGSIGSELARQLASFHPACLVLIDHDDSLLHTTQHSIADGLRQNCVFALGDIRDIARLDELFTEYRPSIVFHAAALKHVPALETAPGEGWKTNVLGTLNVLNTAQRTGVERFVNISTDKAAEPINVLGLTKRIAERITSRSAFESGRTFVSVRFGNVIGSRGSVLETFERQIDRGGPVTVTHPDVTRYFMSVREAVRLTLQAAAIGRGGEVLVLDMGTPVRIVDVARQLIEQRGGGIEIAFTGLRPGEKVSEVLLSPGEHPQRDRHPMIDHVVVPPLDLYTAVLSTYQADIATSLLTPMSLGELLQIAYYCAPDYNGSPFYDSDSSRKQTAVADEGAFT